jgi:hypothetical protein
VGFEAICWLGGGFREITSSRVDIGAAARRTIPIMIMANNQEIGADERHRASRLIGQYWFE